MLIAISGAQGSGKTTTLNKLKEIGFNVTERKTARSVLAEWGKTLDQVYRDPPLTQMFQEECLVRKIDDEKQYVESQDLWFTERSYADVFTYTVLTIGRYNEYDKWMNQYYERCYEMQKKYLGVFYIEAVPMQTENDGVRGINQHYVRLVDQTLSDTMRRMSAVDAINFQPNPPLELIEVRELNRRTRKILDVSNSMWLDKCLPHVPVDWSGNPVDASSEKL